MSYATSDDMIERFDEAQLIKVASIVVDEEDTLDTEKIGRAIAGADAIVDLHLRGRYAVPLATVPPEILGISCDIARYKLYGDATNAPEAAKDAYLAAMKMLVSIRDGDAVLDAPAASASDPAATAGGVELAGDAPFFTRDSLKGF
ncbi:MAG: DUF1320 domain-containing protein [Reyranella sp.]|nr:DUF1320 domain-containing protein [Reyranella sp.]